MREKRGEYEGGEGRCGCVVVSFHHSNEVEVLKKE